MMVLFSQAVIYVCDDLPGQCVEHGLKWAKGRSRETSEEAPIVSQAGIVVVWISIVAI